MQWQPATGHHDSALSSTTSGGWAGAAGQPQSASQPPSQPTAAAEYGAGGGAGASRQFAVGTSSSFPQRLPPQGLRQQAATAATFNDGPSAKYAVYGRPPGPVYPQHK